MFSEFKQKITKEYARFTCILLLIVSLSIYAVGVHMSYKEQLYQIKILAIEESEELYHLQTVKALDVFVDNLSDGGISYFNRIFVYGYDNKEQLLFSHNNMEWSERSIRKIMDDASLPYEKPYFHFELVDNRHPKVFIAMRYPLIEKGDFLGEVYVGMDITHWVREEVRFFFILLIIVFLSMFFVRYVAYKMANRAMVPVVKSFEQQKQFIANASHELRTPLSIIISGLTVLKSDEDNKLTDFSQEVIADIDDESLKMKKLIDNLLLTARNDNDTLNVNPVNFSLSDLIVKLYNKFSLLADRKNITIDLENLEGIFVYADSSHIEQILAILIDNAVKYTAENGRICIKVSAQEKDVVVSVIDNGKGISQEDLPHIFERFYRADKSRTHYGNGLGLSIAQMLAEKNHSTITVTSEENAGSCFNLVIENIYF